VSRAGTAALLATLLPAVLAANTFAQTATPERSARRLEMPRGRVVTGADLVSLDRPERDMKAGWVKPSLRSGPNDYSSFWSPEAPLIPPPAAPPTDGIYAPQAVYGYQPHLTTNFHVPDPDSVVWVPGDCTIAAGPNHLVVGYNSRIAIYDKQGTRLFTSTINSFFGAIAGWKGFFDPKVVYDEGAGRFYFMALDINLSARESRWNIAVSQTSDPTQGWYTYEFRNELDGLGVDYEELGFGPRGLYLCGNYLNFKEWAGIMPAPGSHSATLWVLDKLPMLSGQPVTAWSFDDLVGPASVLVRTPKVALVHTTPFGGVDGFMTSFQSIPNPPNTLRISVWGITLPVSFPNDPPTLASTTVDTDDPGAPPNAAQSGGAGLLQTNNLGLIPMNLQFRSNTLTMATGAASGARSRARVIQLSCTWPTVVLAWQNDFSDGTNYHFWPQAAVNARGQTLLGYCRSGTGEFANFRWTTRTPDDSGFLSSKLLKAGEGYVGNPVVDTSDSLYRWGDYSGVAVDPVSQGFWMFGMYGSPRGTNGNGEYRMWAGYVPRAVYVDQTWAGSEFGTTQRPWNTMTEAISDAFNGNEVVVKAGTYSTPTLITKPITIIADGGVVQLQP